METIQSLQRFNELANDIGNRYEAVMLVCQWARQLEQQYSNYHISSSKLIDWVIQGKCPYNNAELLSRRIITRDDEIDNLLEWVGDEEVKKEVKYLYKKSVKHRHLELRDDVNINKYKRSRINIILRMMWYSVDQKGDTFVNSYLESLVEKKEIDVCVEQGSKPNKIPYVKPEILEEPPICGGLEEIPEEEVSSTLLEEPEIAPESSEICVEQGVKPHNDEENCVEQGSKPHLEEVVIDDNATEWESNYNKGDIIPVKNIRIYRLPTLSAFSVIFTGNVVYEKESLDNFKHIQYMQPGFGLINGYTREI